MAKLLARQEAESSETLKVKRICLALNGIYRIHSTYADSYEVVEEYDQESHLLIAKRFREPLSGILISNHKSWVWEVGDPQETGFRNELISPSNENPIVIRRDSKDHFEWRIRNLFDNENNYKVNLDKINLKIVVTTINRKFYKEILLPEVGRRKLKPEEVSMSFSFMHRALIIYYKKPNWVRRYEQQMIQLVQRSQETS